MIAVCRTVGRHRAALVTHTTTLHGCQNATEHGFQIYRDLENEGFLPIKSEGSWC